MTNISEIRKEYKLHQLDEAHMDKDPFKQFKRWLEEALHAKVQEPTAMSLSTISDEGKPTSRTVLLKEIYDDGFVFFTNYESKKARHLDSNPNASLLFFWPEMERQVRIEGKVNRIASEESDKYFHSRPKESKIGTWASPQSQEIPDREYLNELKEKFEKRFESIMPKRPDTWGGYILMPVMFEFWQGRPSRLHDRLEYYLEKKEWKIRRLAP